MECNGTVLILDNFRSVLSGYDVDIQDVVRSAILDGVDISEYIESCRDNAYKLDQIRLSLKEGITTSIFGSVNGEQLFVIRKMKSKNYKVEPVISQITSGKLQEDYLNYLLSWVTKGVDVSGIKLSLIPRKMLEIFDIYLCQGRDMRPFNNGRIYSKEYVLYCMSIQEKGRDISGFASEQWSDSVLSYLADTASNTPDRVWSSVMSVVKYHTDLDRVKLLFKAAKHKLPVEDLGKSIHGEDAYDNESIAIIIEAAKGGFDYKSLMSAGLDSDERRAKLDEMKMNRGRKVGGVLRRG